MSSKKMLVKNISWNIVTYVTGLVTMFIMTPIVLKALGNSHYGIWSLVLTVASYLELMDFGMRTALIRTVASSSGKNNSDEMNHAVTTMLIYFSIVGLLIIIIGQVFAPFMSDIFKIQSEDTDIAQNVVRIFTIFLGLRFPFNAFTGVLIGKQRYDVTNKIHVLMSITRCILTWFFLSKGYGLITVVVLYSGANFLAMFINGIQSLFIIPDLKIQFTNIKFSALKSMGRLGGSVLGIGLAMRFIDSIGPVIVGMILPVKEVTYYGLAYAFVRYIGGLINSGIRVLIPYIGEMHGTTLSKESLNSKLSSAVYTSCLMTTIITSACCGGILLCGEQFMNLWVGKDVSMQVTPVLYPAMLFALASQVSGFQLNVLLGIGKLSFLPAIYVMEAIISVLLSIFLGKELGVIGVALGGAATTVVIRLAGSFYVLRNSIDKNQFRKLFVNFSFSIFLLLISIALFAYLRTFVILKSYLSLFIFGTIYFIVFNFCCFALFLRPVLASLTQSISHNLKLKFFLTKI